MENMEIGFNAIYAMNISAQSAMTREISSRKMAFLPQASNEQADAQNRPLVSRQMLPFHCHT